MPALLCWEWGVCDSRRRFMSIEDGRPDSLAFQGGGQALECAGVWLADPCFTHGQLYVAASRVDHPSRVDGITRNVGYREVLSYAAGEGGGGYGARRGRDEWGRRASGGRRRWLACAVVAVLGAALGAGWTTWRARRSARARARGRRFGCVNSKRAQRVRAGRARWD